MRRSNVIISPGLARQRVKRASEYDRHCENADPKRRAPDEPTDGRYGRCRYGRCAHAIERRTLGCLSPLINHMPICRLTKSAPRPTRSHRPDTPPRTRSAGVVSAKIESMLPLSSLSAERVYPDKARVWRKRYDFSLNPGSDGHIGTGKFPMTSNWAGPATAVFLCNALFPSYFAQSACE